MSTGRLTLIGLALTSLVLVVLIGFNSKKKDEARVQPPAPPVVQQPGVQPAQQPAPSGSATPAPTPQVTRATQPAKEPARTGPRKIQSPALGNDSTRARGSAPREPVTEVLPHPKPEPVSVPPPPVYVPPPPPPRPTTAVLPAGAPLDVRLMQALSSANMNRGDTFEAQLERDLEVDGKLLAKRGTLVIGKISDVEGSGRVKGRARMSVTLTEIKSGGESYPIQTTAVSFEAEGSAGKDAVKIGGAAGIGAIIGAIAGGGKGAAIGAVIGGGAGTAGVIATKGKEVQLDEEQRLNFTLERQVQMKIQSSKDDDNTSRDVSPARSQDTTGIQKRVEAKVKRFHSLMSGWVARGGDSSRIQPIMQEFQRRVDAGDAEGAEEKIDEALAIIQKN